MRTRRFSVALAALSIPLLAGSAFAVANSVSTTPGPQVIIPSRTSANSPTTAHQARHRGTDERAGHDTTTTGTAPDDHGNDGAGHDVNDDRGHDGTTSTTVSNDGPGHDVNDDHGDDGTTSTTMTTTTTPDNSGHDGTDDGSGHDGTDGGSDSGTSGSGH